MTGPSARIRVLVVDDHAMVRAGVRVEIGGHVDIIDIVGEAADVPSAVEAIRRLRPDVVLLDVNLPGGGGKAVLEGVASTHAEVRFLALSVSDAPADVVGVIRAGASGYVTKAISADDLHRAIERVHAGDAYFSPNLAGLVLDAFRGRAPVPLDPELNQLTDREREVLGLIATGYTYKEAGRRLHISPRTVETHISAVLRKLQLSTRHKLTRWAASRNLL